MSKKRATTTTTFRELGPEMRSHATPASSTTTTGVAAAPRPRSADDGADITTGNSAESTESIASERNIMPSMVVRQQRLAQIGLTSFNPNKAAKHTSVASTKSSTQELCKSAAAAAEQMGLNDRSGSAGLRRQEQLFDEAGLIVPKKVTPLPMNHSVSNAAAAAAAAHMNSALIIPTTMHDLNRELKFNQAHGKNVLDKKSELRRAMDKLEANRRRKEAEVERLNRRSSLELRLEQRAERIAQISEASSDCKQDDGLVIATNAAQQRQPIEAAGSQVHHLHQLNTREQPRASSAGSGRAQDVVSSLVGGGGGSSKTATQATPFNLPNSSRIKSTTR